VIAGALWRRRGAPPAAAALPVGAAFAAAIGAALALAALGLAFPTEGHQPFVFSAFIPIPLAVAAIWLCSEPEDDLIRIGALLYLGLALVAVAVETPLGGNAVRLGVTFAGPLVAVLLVRRRPWILALVAIPLLYWQWTATVRDVAAAEGDPSTEAAYYEPVLGALADRGADGLDRVHVVATRNRWESVYVAEQVPIDGGWLRQLETADGYAYTGDGAEDYLGRLRARGVSWLAVSDAEPDHSAEAELELIESGELAIEPAFESEHWRLYELTSPSSPAADSELTALGSDGFSVDLGPDGSAEPALRWSPYFEVSDGSGCVSERGQWTLVRGRPQATVTVETSLGSAALLGRESSCSD
jgi:hypothetical protein